jgi:hypothetical protein
MMHRAGLLTGNRQATSEILARQAAEDATMPRGQRIWDKYDWPQESISWFLKNAYSASPQMSEESLINRIMRMFIK